MTHKEKPLVTVVTITFNLIKYGRKDYFRQCVESVHSQTYKNIEHIIIDGASTDGTLDLIKKYTDKGWLTYMTEPDSGIYDAANKGINLAKGKYITFLNSDDFFHNNRAVELSVSVLESVKADYSFADTQGIDAENDKRVDVWHGNINLIPFGTHYCHQSMFTKTDVLKEIGGFDLSYKVSADSDMMVKLVALEKKYVYVPECIVSYRSGGLSNQHIEQTRKEHSGVFYKHIGKKIGLTRDECFYLWNFSIFKEKSFFYCVKVAKKLKKTDWWGEYRKRLYSFDTFKKQIKRLLPARIRSIITSLLFLVRSKKA